MPKPRAIAAFLGAMLFAAGLSFGASLAEGDVPQTGEHFTPAGLCLLVDQPVVGKD